MTRVKDWTGQAAQDCLAAYDLPDVLAELEADGCPIPDLYEGLRQAAELCETEARRRKKHGADCAPTTASRRAFVASRWRPSRRDGAARSLAAPSPRLICDGDKRSMSRGLGRIQLAALRYVYEYRVGFTADIVAGVWGPDPTEAQIRSVYRALRKLRAAGLLASCLAFAFKSELLWTMPRLVPKRLGWPPVPGWTGPDMDYGFEPAHQPRRRAIKSAYPEPEKLARQWASRRWAVNRNCNHPATWRDAGQPLRDSSRPVVGNENGPREGGRSV